jgi:two-component system response regulator (stage 0 sporulation protein F)
MKKIVVADDEVRIRMLYPEVLSELGYEVHSAKDGVEAWQLFQEHEPDLVILDVKMPEMHGFEVLEKIREKDPEVPVLICSAYPKLGNDPTVLTMGVVGFINKPIDISTLRTEVKRAMGEDDVGDFAGAVDAFDEETGI